MARYSGWKQKSFYQRLKNWVRSKSSKSKCSLTVSTDLFRIFLTMYKIEWSCGGGEVIFWLRTLCRADCCAELNAHWCALSARRAGVLFFGLRALPVPVGTGQTRPHQYAVNSAQQSARHRLFNQNMTSPPPQDPQFCTWWGRFLINQWKLLKIERLLHTAYK